MASFHSVQRPPPQEEIVEEYTKIIETERNRGNDAERMYEALKKVHEDCTEEFRAIQNQTQRFFEDSESKLKKSDSTIQDLRGTVIDQSKEISELKGNLLTPQKQEVIRLAVQAETDRAYQSRVRSLQDESLSLKTKIASLSQENETLRTDRDLRETKFSRTRAELETKYQRIIEDFRKDKDGLVPSSSAVDLQRLRQLQRDNDQLELRVKAQEIELEAARGAKARWEEDQERASKTQARKIVEREMQLEKAKAETETLRQQVDILRKQVAELSIEVMLGGQKTMKLETEKQNLEADMESLELRHRIELGNERVRHTSEKTALQSEKGDASLRSSKLEGEIGSLKEALEQQRQLVVTKERELQVKLGSVNQQHMVEVNSSQQETRGLEEKLAAADKRLSTLELDMQSQADKLSQEQKFFSAAQLEASKEVETLRQRIAEHVPVQMAFGQLKADHDVLERELRGLLDQVGNAESMLRRLQNEKLLLEKEIANFDEMDRIHRQELQQVSSDQDQTKQRLKTEWEQKRASYDAVVKEQDVRLEEHRKQIILLQEQVKEREQKYRSYKKRTRIVVGELVAALKAKSAMVELTKDAVSPEVHGKVLDELALMKKLLVRLRGIILPGNVANKTLQLELNQIAPTQPALDVGELFDRQFRMPTAVAPRLQVNESDTIQSLFKRLKPLGFSESGLDENEGNSDGESDSIFNLERPRELSASDTAL